MQEDDNQDLKRWQIWLPTMVALSLVFGIFTGLKLQENQPLVIKEEPSENGSSLGYGRMEELVRYIDAKYVEDVEGDELVKTAIEEVLRQLDPHSSYITKEELRSVNEQLQGNFDGIGIEFMLLDDTIVVVSPLTGGPSEIAGIITGDKIIQVEDSIIAGKNLNSDEIVEFLRGEKGTKVTLGILRGGEEKIKKVTVTRDKIPTNSVDAHFMVDGKTGFIKINRFSATTYEDFMKSMEDLVDKNEAKNLIIDLRQNPGGYLQEATSILSQLFDKRGKLLVYTEGRNVRRSDYETSGGNFFDIDKIAVLVDEGSASASEILAGAIQDWDRGTIIGRRSFGKGLVQEQYKLSDGSALRLTVARYYTPSGRCIQRDYSDEEHYEDDFHARLESGELQTGEAPELADTTKFYTAGGRIVYGGGGISPDVFVPLDTLVYNEDYLNLRQESAPFIFKYYEANKANLKYDSVNDFMENFNIPESLYQEFLAFAAAAEINPSKKVLNKIEKPVKKYLKARLAKHLFDENALFQVLSSDDPFILEALESFKNPSILPIVENNN
jgi:carboxyl-terminal processing protease